MVKKALTWLFVAFLIFFIAYRPEAAAQVFKSLGNGLVDIATGIGEFFPTSSNKSTTNRPLRAAHDHWSLTAYPEGRIVRIAQAKIQSMLARWLFPLLSYPPAVCTIHST